MMRYFLILPLLCLISSAGCDRPAAQANMPTQSAPDQVIAGGELISVTLWEKPIGTLGMNGGTTPPKGSRVKVYEKFILVTYPDGITRQSLNGWYSGLQFKADAR
jgi:hypothetical protein